MRFLLNTNIISEPAKASPDPKVLSKLTSHQAASAIAASTWHELLVGLCKLPLGKKREQLSQYIWALPQSVTILPYDERAARWHAEQRTALLLKGHEPPFIDGLIAAVAAANDLTLVTINTKDFRFYSGLTLLNWFEC